jgi:hypothetical protein
MLAIITACAGVIALALFALIALIVWATRWTTFHPIENQGDFE